ncbi:terminase small subunit [Microbacterium phage OscarSo]|uniref:Terminase small subunit n=1 Tax=Microbacterium phage OscarSo TaxID=2985324 RepID=A0A9X9K503_9CAUD|nr:terminase small subunit [Microbacterium phage OscarSo]UYL87125.1 terminase small subunit [Microbacterium phage OscarSo]
MSTSPKAELIEARVVAEQAWMHARWMERMTFRQIAAAAALPVERGGLGITVSPAGVKAMVHAHREAQGDLTMSREDRRERMSDELDEVARGIRHELAKFAEEHDGAVNLKLVEALLAVGKREADLHGLAAPTEIRAEVTHVDAIDAELDAMLERMPGRASS